MPQHIESMISPLLNNRVILILSINQVKDLITGVVIFIVGNEGTAYNKDHSDLYSNRFEPGFEPNSYTPSRVSLQTALI